MDNIQLLISIIQTTYACVDSWSLSFLTLKDRSRHDTHTNIFWNLNFRGEAAHRKQTWYEATGALASVTAHLMGG